ncbi:Ubiquitin protein ligase E3A [Fasciola hepatica]|uniref:HECT-type E3 ubiquitin transferase n=1 Tax=Fasciola hepatica TaxID=6192 RepID=A0A4E0RKA0_FASHE|nr:Ubiquitin protein ligase E3A [Fasciola hepatica]
MNDPSSRVQQLIIRYFNQLLRGCSNPNCPNTNCASSSSFAHPNLDANRAAVLAMRLTADRAPLCYPDYPSVNPSTNSASSIATTEDYVMTGADEADESIPAVSEPHDEAVMSSVASTTSTGQNSAISPQNASTRSISLGDSIAAAEESSHSSMMTSRQVTRLLMLLFDASENDDVGSSAGNEEYLTNEEQSSHISRAATGPSGRGSAREQPSLAMGTGRLSSFNPFPGPVDPSTSTSAETLKTLLSNSAASNTISSLVSSSNTFPERESRTEGLTLAELKESIAIGRKEGDWSHLISLLSAVFSSYEALSSSFPSQADITKNEEKSDALNRFSSSSSLVPGPAFDPSQPTGDGMNEIRGDQKKRTGEAPMDEDETISKLTKGMNQKNGVPTENDVDAPLSSSSSSVQIKRAHCSNSVPPVCLPDVRSAWSMIFLLPERQTVVDALMRAVRRLVVSSLYQLLVTQTPEGLGESSSFASFGVTTTSNTAPVATAASRNVNSVCASPYDSGTLQGTQQRIINLFIILYECPFATDPLHFEHLLLNINRAATWLPELLQAQLCRAWAESVHLPLANSSVPPSPEQTNLWSLQRILLHHITLRCLTTDYNAPNEDKQICEAALVLRMVYYASLLAGQMDSPELLAQEELENREFESQLQTIRNNHRTRRSRVPPPEDPLAKALHLSPNDCRKPFIPAKDFINETLNEGLKPRQDYVNYRSKDPFSELSFMKLPFLLETSSKSTLLYYDNRMRMLDERRGVVLQSFFVDIPELPFLKLHISRDRIVEDALLGLEIACLENPGDLKKQLLVEFEDEQGIDEGGLSKEFFQLIIEKIFDPVYGMFVLDEQCQTYWFNPVPLEDLDREYCLIGILLGLAIYNDVILDVHFPAVLYRKLVGKLGTYEDLKDARPDLFIGLQALLDYEDNDLQEAFDCYFVIYYQDPFGNTLSHELKPSGSSIPVTKENRQDYDFKELERVTNYEDYTSDSPVIKNFWTVVHSMNAEQQRQLLQFATGSDRIPVGGMSKMKFTIARQGADADRLPTAHTCFNILLLPDYLTLEQLQHHLLIAITYCKGFGMS